MSADLDRIISQVRQYVEANPPTSQEKDEQAISFALGNLNSSTHHQTTREVVEAQYYKLQTERLRAEVKSLKDGQATLNTLLDILEHERCALRWHNLELSAENETLRKQLAEHPDTKRLDWLDHYIREGFKNKLVTHFERVGDPDNTPLRKAIDQAMEGK